MRYASSKLYASSRPKRVWYLIAPQCLDEVTALLLKGNKPMLKHVFLHKHDVFEEH
jgi:hypothetical protein